MTSTMLSKLSLGPGSSHVLDSQVSVSLLLGLHVDTALLIFSRTHYLGI